MGFKKSNKKTNSGWAFYSDTTYVEGSPFTVSQGSKVKLPNNKGIVIEDNLPKGYSSFYDNDKIITENSGDSISVSVRFKVKSTINQGGFSYSLDIGGTQGEIVGDSRRLLRGAGAENKINLESTPFCGNTFISNGADVFVEAISGTMLIYDISYKITLNHVGK